MINIDELIRSFESKSKNKKERFSDFLYFCFHSFDKVIENKKHKRYKDKYIVTREKLINYLIVNEKTITLKLLR